ncbi:hypothetical protein Ahy_B08g089590 [Arachis hypogaea]|uniref:BED-type domain-containing protein n=1 Tax=Arachis hypogaea TaxID=3818 RepID=A0A444XYA7_ARAHY|nr:hypothetical protein Ahy_B08g089590 [Arachis hypogaea]
MMNAESESLIPTPFSLSLSQFSFTILIKVQREVENAITISPAHTATRVRRRAVMSVAQSAPSSNHFLRPVTTRRRCMDESINQELPRNNNAENNSASNECSLPPVSNENQPQTSSVREKSDLAWRYVALQNINEKPYYQSLFCLSTFGGGGINRMKKHLAKIGGDIKKCSKVPYDVEKQMEGLLKEIQKSKTSKRKVSFNEEGTDECEDAIDEAIAQEEQQTPSQLPTKEVIGGDLKKESKNHYSSYVCTKNNSEKSTNEIDADLDQGGDGGGGSTSTFYAFSGPSSENEGDEINDANLQQVMENFDD